MKDRQPYAIGKVILPIEIGVPSYITVRLYAI